MRISDWSSDVCSSDLFGRRRLGPSMVDRGEPAQPGFTEQGHVDAESQRAKPGIGDRKSVVSGKSVSVRVDLGGRRIIKKKNKHKKHIHSYNIQNIRLHDNHSIITLHITHLNSH